MPLDSIAVLSPLDRATDANGNPVPGAKLKFYEAGTSTPKTVYSDSGLTQSLGSTVTCDAGGYPTSDGSTQVSIYVGSDAYKLVVTTSADVTVHTRDNLKGAPEIPDVASTALPETPVISRTSTYSILSSDQGELIQADPTGGSFALTLPSAITVGDGWRVGVRHNGASTSNVATVRAIGGQAVGAPGQSAATSISLTGYGQTIWLVSNGADWVIDGTAEPLMMGGLPLFKVTDRLVAPPTSPVGGNRYIINGTPTGVWLTLGFAEHDVAEADGNGSWLKYTPQSGWMAWVDDEDLLSIYKDGAWDDQTGMSTPGTSTRKVAIFLDQKSDGTVGGSVTTGAWTTHALQTTVVNTLDSAVLATNVITLGAGTYKITGRFVIQDVNGAGISLLQGASTRHYGINQSSGADTTSPHVETVITIASGTDTIALQYYAQNSNSTSDLGPALGLSGNLETYAILTIEDLSSLQGPQGEQGIQGNDGLDAAIPMQWSTATSGDPGSGKVRGNNATIASITEIAVSETDAAGGALGNVLTGWAVSTSSAKGTLKLTKEGAPQNFHVFRITASGTDLGSYRTFAATYVSTSGTISNGNDLAMLFVEKGDIGDPGTTVPDISGLTEDTANDDEADFLIEYDTSAANHKKVKPKNLGFTASGGTRRGLQAKLRDRVCIMDYGAVADGNIANANLNAAALAAALATGKSVEIPWTSSGYHFGTNSTIAIASGQRILGEGQVKLKSTVTGSNCFLRLTGFDDQSGVEDVHIDMDGAGATSTAIRFGTNSATPIYRPRLKNLRFSSCVEAIGDESHATNYVTDVEATNIFCWLTRGNQIRVRRSRGHTLFRDVQIDRTYDVGTVNFGAALFEDFAGIELDRFDVVGPASDTTFRNVWAIDIQGNISGGYRAVWLRRAFADSANCNGIRVQNADYVWLHAEGNLCLGDQVSLISCGKVFIDDVYAGGSNTGRTGAAAGANGLTINTCTYVGGRVLAEKATGSGLLVHDSQYCSLDVIASNDSTAYGVNETGTSNNNTFKVGRLNGNSTAASSLVGADSRILFGTDYVTLTGTQTLTNKTLTNPAIVGTTTNDSAAAGNVGQYIESVIASGSAVSLTSTTPANMTSISLTAGDWDVDCVFQFTGAGTTTVTYLIGSISTTSATLDSTAGRRSSLQENAATAFNNIADAIITVAIPPLRFSLSGTTTLYAVAQALFGTSTCSVFGILRARRVR